MPTLMRNLSSIKRVLLLYWQLIGNMYRKQQHTATYFQNWYFILYIFNVKLILNYTGITEQIFTMSVNPLLHRTNISLLLIDYRKTIRIANTIFLKISIFDKKGKYIICIQGVNIALSYIDGKHWSHV